MIQRIGIGYDIHRLVKGRRLVLGGVEIPYPRGLYGHSDADVLLHAICDAVLGALGRGDIGEHFPNTDRQYKNISSLILLTKVNELVRRQGYKVAHIDSVVLAEQPNLKPFKAEMRFKIAAILHIPSHCVSIKATTQEGLGTRNGIAAWAIALLNKRR